MREHLISNLRRLAYLDNLLATVGVCATHASKKCGVSDKTIRRDLDLLHELSPLVYVDETWGRRRWFYEDRRRRIFTPQFAREGR